MCSVCALKHPGGGGGALAGIALACRSMAASRELVSSPADLGCRRRRHGARGVGQQEPRRHIARKPAASPLRCAACSLTPVWRRASPRARLHGVACMAARLPARTHNATRNPTAAGIRLAGATNDVHIFDIRMGEWVKITPMGEPPSPRAAHAAAAVGNMVVIQVRCPPPLPSASPESWCLSIGLGSVWVRPAAAVAASARGGTSARRACPSFAWHACAPCNCSRRAAAAGRHWPGRPGV